MAQEEAGLINELIHLISSSRREWDNVQRIVEVHRKLIQVQGGRMKRKQDDLSQLNAWLVSNGMIGSDKVHVQYIGKQEGNGLVAKTAINEGEYVIGIPRKLMLTLRNAALLSNPLISIFPSTGLALQLILEERDPNSFWLPYINCLPDHVPVPLLLPWSDWQSLQHSSARPQAVACLFNISRQYVSLYSNKQHMQLFSGRFTLGVFLWATAIVLSRQNQLNSDEIALIPGWDMCNHLNGPLTTVYDEHSGILESSAMQSFHMNEQIRICYGHRSNPELLIHAGFVVENNPFDDFRYEIPLNQQDPLLKLKKMLLNKLQVLNQTGDAVVISITPSGWGPREALDILDLSKDEIELKLRGRDVKSTEKALDYIKMIVEKLQKTKQCENPMIQRLIEMECQRLEELIPQTQL